MADTSWITQIAHEGGIVELQLNRAPVNALDADGLMGLRDVVQTLETDKAVRALVITSGCKVFSAGLNLKDAQHFDTKQQQAIVTGLNEGFLALFQCAKPVICAVNGPAIAGGLFFVLSADVRIATPRAQFGLAEIRVGVGFPAGPLGIAKAMLDTNTTRRMMQSGQPISAEAGMAAGLIDEVVEADILLPRALETAAEYADLPSEAYSAVKMQLRGEAIAATRAAIDAETAAGQPWFTSQTRSAMAKMLG